MTPICCALIVRGTSSFLPIMRACANKVRSLSPYAEGFGEALDLGKQHWMLVD